MATTNYNLPTISGASPVAIVDDFNALANATDAALAGAISGEKTRAMAAETELANGVSNALTTANSANVSATDAKSAADKAQATATTALTDAATAQTAANKAQTTADAVNALATEHASELAQVKPDDQFYFGHSGYQRAETPGGAYYTDFNWEWVNGTLHFGGRETISSTFPDPLIALPAGCAKPFIPSDSTGDVIIGYGSAGNNEGRTLAEVHYNTLTDVLSIKTPYMTSSSSPVFIDTTVCVGMDLSTLE